MHVADRQHTNGPCFSVASVCGLSVTNVLWLKGASWSKRYY